MRKIYPSFPTKLLKLFSRPCNSFLAVYPEELRATFKMLTSSTKMKFVAKNYFYEV